MPLYRNFVVTDREGPMVGDADSLRFAPGPDKGKPLRIGILESGVWTGFALYFDAVIEALTYHGWGKPAVYEALSFADRQSIEGLVNLLGAKGWSPHLEFPQDAYSRLTLENRETAVAALAARQDIDMIIGLGTWAGKELKKLPSSFTTPCVIMAVSKPLQSGILDSPEDSGRDNITGRVDTGRFKRQVAMFHDIIGFRRLGLVYAGSDPSGALYAALPDIMVVQTERASEGVLPCTVVTATDVPPSGNIGQVGERYIENLDSILGEVDAFYLTLQNGVNSVTLPKLVERFNAGKIPTFYMGGGDYVRRGILLSIASNWKPIGEFNARKIIRILKGASPRSLGMIFEAEPRIAINLETARLIGYDPPVEVLASADEIYTTIEP